MSDSAQCPIVLNVHSAQCPQCSMSTVLNVQVLNVQMLNVQRLNVPEPLDWLPNSPSFREFSEWNDILDLRCCHWHWAILTINHFLFQIQMNVCFRRFQGFVHFGLNSQSFYECQGIVGLHLLLMYIDDEPEVRRGEINCLQSCKVCNEQPSN